METEGEPIGTCVRCGAVGPVGEPCGNVRCQSSKNCFLPDEYARAPATDAMLGVAIDGRYLILSLLGVGGFGRVYVARHLRTDQLVAIKQIDRADPARAAELLREARTLARLKHPNIVLLQDYGELDGRPYMVMEHVDPVIALEDALRTAPTEADRLRLLRGVLRQALDGLGYAHALGVVHRDLKPGNVLIRRLPSELLVKIVDFGLAKCLDDGRTNSRDAGTPLYMAPEQIGRRAVSPATDLYALGAMLFEEVTGQEPFDGTLADVLVQKVTPGHDPLARVPEGALAPEMRELLAASLAYEPAARPQDTDAFRAAMERAFKAQIALVEAGGGAVARAPRAVGLGSADTGVLEVPARIDPNGATMDAPGDAAGGGVLRTVTASAAAEALEAMAARPIETAPVDSATALAVERARSRRSRRRARRATAGARGGASGSGRPRWRRWWRSASRWRRAATTRPRSTRWRRRRRSRRRRSAARGRRGIRWCCRARRRPRPPPRRPRTRRAARRRPTSRPRPPTPARTPRGPGSSRPR
ncbi:MAG: serine/threonine protein kinase [Deltaproteobacteria bacterium]|nr:serine/threonine protein kinase [Deltaproteobacteria bacterium]